MARKIGINYCMDCGLWFIEPQVVKTTYESMYGVSDLFPDSTPTSYDVCPRCGSEEIYDDLEEDEMVEILNKKNVKLGKYRDW